MLMMRNDILLLSDEEVLASLDAYKKRKAFNADSNLKPSFLLRAKGKIERANSILFGPRTNSFRRN
tara:strand:- start:3704 stop:3901 length:198 start_codon:yes stop_codon:yes gene_type:complete